MTDLIELDHESIDRDIASAGPPILIDFWAPWCGSCRLLMPTVSALAQEMSDELQFAKLNVNEFPDVAERLNVNALPTLVMYRDGKEVARFTGVKNKSSLAKAIREHL